MCACVHVVHAGGKVEMHKCCVCVCGVWVCVGVCMGAHVCLSSCSSGKREVEMHAGVCGLAWRTCKPCCT